MRRAIIGALLLAGCSDPSPPPPAPQPVQTVVLGGGREAPFRRFPGEVAARRTTELSFDVAGRMVERPASSGMLAKEGELLARLDDANFVARVDAARAEANTARQELARRTQLRERGVISASELDDFRRRYDVAEAALREAERALEDTRLLAPSDGRVARTLLTNFTNVRAKEPVLVFQDLEHLEVNIQIPEADMARVDEGVTAQNARDRIEAAVEFAAFPGERFPLELFSFQTAASDAARTFRITFRLNPPEGRNVLPGMTATVMVRKQGAEAGQDEGVFEIPAVALSTTEGTPSVWKLDPATLKVARVPVEVGGMGGDAVLVSSENLAPGDEIVTTGVRFLSEGMAVSRIPNR